MDLREKTIISSDDSILVSPFFIYYFLSSFFVSLLIKELMGHVCSNYLSYKIKLGVHVHIDSSPILS
jgi:hypothetical protein